jgi:hypothetical protein
MRRNTPAGSRITKPLEFAHQKRTLQLQQRRCLVTALTCQPTPFFKRRLHATAVWVKRCLTQCVPYHYADNAPFGSALLMETNLLLVEESLELKYNLTFRQFPNSLPFPFPVRSSPINSRASSESRQIIRSAKYLEYTSLFASDATGSSPTAALAAASTSAATACDVGGDATARESKCVTVTA